MSARLTKYDRDQMAKALTRHRFNDCAQGLMLESAALFNAVLDERYDTQTLKLMRQLQKRQPKAFDQVDCLGLRPRGFCVSVGARSIGAYGKGVWMPVVARRSVLHGHDCELNDQLTDRAAQFGLDTKKFAEDVSEAYRRALATLSQFTTGKALVEKWPEAIPVIGSLIPSEDRSLPVVQLQAINDEFGLPPSELEAA